MCKRLRIPPRFSTTGLLVLALMPCHLMPAKHEELSQRADEIKFPPLPIPKDLRIDPKLQGGLRILSFPEWFISWIALGSRKFSVWSPVPGRPFKRGMALSTDHDQKDDETSALFKLLKYYKCENANFSSDTRIVFVHVGAVTTAHQIPLLGQWRGERPEVRFATFGRHECIRPSYWCTRELWALGIVSLIFSNKTWF